MRPKWCPSLKFLGVRAALALSLLLLLGITCEPDETVWDDIKGWTLLNQKPRTEGVEFREEDELPNYSFLVIPNTLLIPAGGSGTLTVAVSRAEMIEDLRYTRGGNLNISRAAVGNGPDEGFPENLTARYIVQAPSNNGVYQIIFRTVIETTHKSHLAIQRNATVIVVPSGGQGVAGATQIAAGDNHSLAIVDGGTVWSWGLNDHGQLGDGTTVSRLAPVQVLGLPGPAVAVAAGANHSLALLSDKTVWGWGDNSKYQISSARLPEDSTVSWPLQAMRRILTEPDPNGLIDYLDIPLIGVQAIAAGANHSLALITTGAVWASGDNDSYQLGARFYQKRLLNGLEIDVEDHEASWSRVPVPLDIPMVAVAAGEDFSLSLDENGQVWGWGNNTSAQLGDSFGRQYDTPIEMLLFSGVQAIAAGDNHTLALKNDGSVLAAGGNFYGQLGDDTQPGQTTVLVPGLSGIVAIDGGSSYSLALGGEGTVYTWGSSTIGELVRLEGSAAAIIQGLREVQAIAAGGQHALCLMPGCGSIWAWGSNGSGQLGDGTGQSSSKPVQVDGIGEASEPGPCEVPLSIIVVGKGVVRSPLAGIECRSTWGQSFFKGTALALTADPDNDWFFQGWAGDAQGTDETVNIRMDGSKNYIAYFAPALSPPTARFTFSPQYPFTTDKVVFDASESFDNSRIVLYQWDFNNDGQFDGVMHDTTLDGSFTAAFVREFWRAGTYTVRLRVTDDDGLTDETTREIHVGQAEPAEYDLGDAPDSSNSIGRPMLAYPDKGIEAHYPTVYRPGSPPYGPRHHNPQNGIHLGRTVTLENEADVGVDEDPNNNLDWLSGLPNQDGGDDGVRLPSSLPSCGRATLRYTVTLVDPPHQYMYVNVWFDWNRDGDWDDVLDCPDGSTVPEHGVQNEEMYSYGSGTEEFSVSFKCWHPSKEAELDPFWMRITLSEERPPSGAPAGTVGYGGSGPQKGYEYGETEDYYVQP